jgi:hypothetical protein
MLIMRSAIIWLDAGRDLSHGDEAPWQGLRSRQRSSRSDSLPIIRHIPSKLLSSMPNFTNVRDLPSLESLPQSTYHLPEQYDLTLDSKVACIDPLYALSELFFSINSESQFLNLMERRMNDIMENFKDQETLALDNLDYSRQLIGNHIQHIENMTTFLESELTRQWPIPENRHQEALLTQALLVDDFAHLARRANHLSAQILGGMNFISNGVMLEESRKAIAKADGTNRLTLLAFFFLPLSFTTSLFGTNFMEFGTGVLSIWVLFATLVPVTIFCNGVMYMER